MVSFTNSCREKEKGKDTFFGGLKHYFDAIGANLFNITPVFLPFEQQK